MLKAVDLIQVKTYYMEVLDENNTSIFCRRSINGDKDSWEILNESNWISTTDRNDLEVALLKLKATNPEFKKSNYDY